MSAYDTAFEFEEEFGEFESNGRDEDMFLDAADSPLSEEEEEAWAAELVNVSSDEELEEFLGSLIKKAGKAAGKFIKSPVGKALGGASGGYTSGRKEIVAWLRQRSRPYLFSNSLAPVIAATTLTVLEMLQSSGDLRDTLRANAEYFRAKMIRAGFELAGADHPIIPVMLGDAALAQNMAARMLELGVYVIGFSFPVVPKGAARIRTQISAAHTIEDIDRALEAFGTTGRERGVIS